MALALLRYDGPGSNGSRFHYDIGKNRYYTFAIGKKQVINQHGLDLLDEPTYKSQLIGPITSQHLGRGFFEVSSDLVDSKNRFIQFLSFRDKELNGPAISKIIRVPVNAKLTVESGELPEIIFSYERDQQLERNNIMNNPTPSDDSMLETVPFQFKERQMSNAMFLGAIAGMLPSILPAIAPIAGKLLGGLFGGGKKASDSGGDGGGGALPGGLGDLLKSLASPDVIKQLMDLVGNISKATSVNNVHAQSVNMSLQSTPTQRHRHYQRHHQALASSLSSAQQLRFPSRRNYAIGSASNFVPAQSQYSQTFFAPALLAALPALIPLLKQVISPENIKTVIDAPAKHTGMIINGIKDFAKLGIESHEQDLKHLRELNPGVDDAALDKLLMSMSLGVEGFRHEANYKRVDTVSLQFDGVAAKDIYGQNKIPYMFGSTLSFPLSVQTPQMISHAQLQLQVKDPDTLEVLYQNQEDIGSVNAGAIGVVPTVNTLQIKGMEVNKDYLVCVAVIWKNKRGQHRGSSIQQKISLVGEYTFDRVEDSSQLIPLNDMVRYREFWHKVWHGNFTDDKKRYEFDSKYYYVLNPKRQNNVRIETRTKAVQEDDKQTGKLKTGMELSPYALNKLMDQLLPESTSLAPNELQGLLGNDFTDRFNQAATYHAKFRGRSGDSAALWIYPEFKLHTVVMLKAEQIQQTGHIKDFVEHSIRFPIPAQIHFIGVKSS